MTESAARTGSAASADELRKNSAPHDVTAVEPNGVVRDLGRIETRLLGAQRRIVDVLIPISYDESQTRPAQRVSRQVGLRRQQTSPQNQTTYTRTAMRDPPSRGRAVCENPTTLIAGGESSAFSDTASKSASRYST